MQENAAGTTLAETTAKANRRQPLQPPHYITTSYTVTLFLCFFAFFKKVVTKALHRYITFLQQQTNTNMVKLTIPKAPDNVLRYFQKQCLSTRRIIKQPVVKKNFKVLSDAATDTVSVKGICLPWMH
jgi:hypothetical protein